MRSGKDQNLTHIDQIGVLDEVSIGFVNERPLGAVAIDTGTEYTVTGLTVGKEYVFWVESLQGEERIQTHSNSLKATATAEEKQTWGFTCYGPSTNSAAAVILVLRKKNKA